MGSLDDTWNPAVQFWHADTVHLLQFGSKIPQLLQLFEAKKCPVKQLLQTEELEHYAHPLKDEEHNMHEDPDR